MLTLAVALGPAAGAIISGQPAVIIDDPHVGDCEVAVRLNGVPAGAKIGLIVEFSELKARQVADSASATFVLGEPLQQGFVVRARLNGDEAAAVVVPPPTGNTTPRGVCSSGGLPTDVSFYASAFLGALVDLSAGENIASGEHVHSMFGVSADYRLTGAPESRAELWVSAQVVHGVRTINLACGDSANAASSQLCTSGSASPTALIQNSSSIEAFVAPRIEFAHLNIETNSSAHLFVASHFGLVAIQDESMPFVVEIR